MINVEIFALQVMPLIFRPIAGVSVRRNGTAWTTWYTLHIHNEAKVILKSHLNFDAYI